MVLIFWLEFIICVCIVVFPLPAAMPSTTHNFFFFLKDSGQAIPLVVESCIRYINLYGKLGLGAVFSALSRTGAGLLSEEMRR